MELPECVREYLSRHEKCHLCDVTCMQCVGPEREDCTSCSPTRFFDDGRCDIRCQAGRFPMGRQCHLCHHTCHECTDEGPDNCTSCDRGEVADAENEDCLHCDEGCKQCKRKDSGHQEQETVCLKCEDGYYQFGTDCHQSCPDRTYSVDNTMVCAQCEDKQCVNCDHAQCYVCEDGFYVSDGECVEHCREGFFVDEESQECEPCHRACRTCGGPRYDDCDSCEEGFTLKSGECLEGEQSAPCSEKSFRNKKGDCEACEPLCKTCSVSARDCSSCYPGHFLTARRTCALRCESGTFANKVSSQCEACPKGCIMCQDAQQCQRCHNLFYLYNGACVVDCPRGIPQSGICQPCASKCASCHGNTSHCLSCDRQYLLLDHSCRENCPEGYYATERECLRCPADCRECNQDGLCKKCADYFFLHDDKCVDDCPTGYFASEKQQECVRCHADCASCDGPGFDDCDVCRNPKAVRYNGECLAKCLKRTYYDKSTNECRDCDRSCLTCSGHEPSSCLSCDINRRKDASGHCIWFNECSLTSYMDQNGDCQQCHKYCHRCSGSGKEHCLSCNKPDFLLNNTCVQECPVGYYAEDHDERVCERCHFSCTSCTGHHSQQCVVCKPGFFKQGKSCVETCSESHFGNSRTMVCEHCDPSCNQCWGHGNTNCLSCRDEYVYLRQGRRGQCLQSCPSGYYLNSWSKSCHKCHPTCKTCNREGALACQTCYEGFTFMNGICESKCLVGFFAASQVSQSQIDKPNCKMCDLSCMDCRGPSMWNCTLCPALQILADDGRCLSCCGNDMRLMDDKPIPWQCCDCEASRDECILGVNFVLQEPKDLDVQGSTAKRFVTVYILLILIVGGGIFLFLYVRSKSLPVPGMPKIKAGGYEKLDNNGEVGSKPTSSSLGDYNDGIIKCDDSEGEEEEEDDDDDIVYMAQDGTVYRKFKYGLLDEDEIELEYDDESYSYR
ncbi:proprotein convertase subtilisin/kexin type 5-like [Scomber scombrus]|uniref:proprotein convertase subtilisin/kexin type 5-like n=1 Tax=Scomber scombrus TaxID=13677 RepID=UPI002DDA9A7B|nr:proprotein convertase subtilisin/kexin type 5-like [Scomber scombrus]